MFDLVHASTEVRKAAYLLNGIKVGRKNARFQPVQSSNNENENSPFVVVADDEKSVELSRGEVEEAARYTWKEIKKNS